MSNGQFAKTVGGYAARTASSAAGAIANAAVRSLADGSDFGDNLIAALPDVIGSTIGEMVADGARSIAAAIATDHKVSDYHDRLDVADDTGAARNAFDHMVDQGLDPEMAFFVASRPAMREALTRISGLAAEVEAGRLSVLPAGNSDEISFDLRDGGKETYKIVNNYAIELMNALGTAKNDFAEFDAKYGISDKLAVVSAFRDPGGTLLSLLDQLAGGPIASLIGGAKDTVADGLQALSLGGNASGVYVHDQRNRTDDQIKLEIAAPDQARAIAQRDRFQTDHAGALVLVDLLAGLAGMAGGMAVAGGGRGPSPRAAETAAPLTRAQVRAKIFGTAQQTGNDGAHAFRSYREAILLARNPEVEAVFLNRGYNRGLDLAPGTISPNRRPDVLGRYFDGRVDRVEVWSRTDFEDVLIDRNTALDPQIIQRGYTPLPPRVVRPVRGQ